MRTLDALSLTALTPFWARVFDSSRPDSILGDRPAAELAPVIEQRFGMVEVSESTRVGCCLRNLYFDQWLARLASPEMTVVDIGVGLDTRLRRSLIPCRRYIEVDSADMIALRDELIRGTGAVRIAGDGLDLASWAGVLDIPHRTTAVILEGVLTYQDPAKVHRFFRDLAGASGSLHLVRQPVATGCSTSE